MKSIEEARASLDFGVWAWVFMPDHIHLIVHPRRAQYDMAVIRRRIKEPAAKQALAWIRENAPEWLAKLRRERGGRTEHLFWQSGGGYDRNIIEGPTLLKMIDYLHENLVRKGLLEMVERGMVRSYNRRKFRSLPFLLPSGRALLRLQQRSGS